MALTGIFLILFLVVHLAGNLQLLRNDEGAAFNAYAHFMGANPLIQTIAVLNFTFILLHVFVSAVLTKRNNQARPVKYAYVDNSSTWSSRNMGILGTLLLVFLVVHLSKFWFRSKFGDIPLRSYGAEEYKDLYTVSVVAFQEWWLVLFYLVSMGVLAFHLSHGFQSAFQTLGVEHPKYSPLIRRIGIGFSVVIPALFAFIPVYLFLVY